MSGMIGTAVPELMSSHLRTKLCDGLSDPGPGVSTHEELRQPLHMVDNPLCTLRAPPGGLVRLSSASRGSFELNNGAQLQVKLLMLLMLMRAASACICA